MFHFCCWVLVQASGHLSLSDVLARAKAQAREVVLARADVKEAEASSVGAGVFLPVNPRLFGDYRRIATELPGQPVTPRDGLNIGIDGTLEISGAGFARAREATERAQVASHDLETARAGAVQRAWVSYVTLQIAEARTQAMREALAIAQRVQLATAERVRLGAASEAESATVGLEMVSVSSLVLEEERRQQLATVDLQQAMDSNDTFTELDALAVPPNAPRTVDGLVAQALEKRPELAAARARLGLLAATDSRLFREAVPKLGYNGGLDVAPASPAFGFVGISIELAIAQRNQGPRAIVQARKDTEELRLLADLRAIARQVTASHASFVNRRAQFELIDHDAQPLAERSVELVEAGWRAGRFDIFRFTNTTRELLRVKRERLDLLLAAWSDYIALQRASGAL